MSIASAPQVVPVKLANAIIGPVMAGNCVHLVLYGFAVSTFNSHLETRSWRKSSWYLRSVIWSVMILVTVMAGLDINDIVHYATLQERDLAHIIVGTAPECFKPMILGMIGVIVQSVLVTRTARVITNQSWRTAYFCFLVPVLILEMFGAAAATAWSLRFHTTMSMSKWLSLSFDSAKEFWMWSAAAADIVITGLYIFAIRKSIRGTSALGDNLLKVIIRLSLRSAAYTAVLALVTAIATQVVQQKSLASLLIPYAFWNPLPALYAVSLFTTLSVAERAGRSADSFVNSKSDMFNHSPSVGNTLTWNAHLHSPSLGHGGPIGTSSRGSAAPSVLRAPVQSTGDVQLEGILISPPQKEGGSDIGGLAGQRANQPRSQSDTSSFEEKQR